RMRHIESLDQPFERACLLERIEVLALNVPDERQRDGSVVGHVADDCGNLVQPRELRGSPATFAGNDLVAPRLTGRTLRQRTDDDRLNDALRLDRLGELLQGLRAHVDARLIPAAL